MDIRHLERKKIRIEERRLRLQEEKLRQEVISREKSGWRNPLVIAVVAATFAAAGNAVIALINGTQNRITEDRKAEQSRILEVIKVVNPDAAATNLQFLLDAGLISSADFKANIENYLENREDGKGVAVAVTASQEPPAKLSLDELLSIADLSAVIYARESHGELEPLDSLALRTGEETLHASGSLAQLLLHESSDIHWILLTAPVGKAVAVNSDFVDDVQDTITGLAHPDANAHILFSGGIHLYVRETPTEIKERLEAK